MSTLFNASFKLEQEVTLKAGETKLLNIELDTRKDRPGRFYEKRLVYVEREFGLMPLP